MSHAARFPLYRVRTPPERTLALYTDNRLITEHGEEVLAPDWESLRQRLEEQHLLILSAHPLRQAGLLDPAVADPDADVLLTKENGIAAIRAQHRSDRRRSGWIVPCSGWGGLPGGPHSLQVLRVLFTALDVGVYPTPSALGLAYLRHHWQGAPSWRPARWYWDLIHHAIVGGRVDLPLANVGRTYPRAWGLDMTGAYPWAAQSLPAGSAAQFWGTPPKGLATYFQRCRLDPPEHPPALGPLPQRHRQTNALFYPTDAVLWGAWWKEELEDAEACGYTIDRGKGVGWESTTDAVRLWATTLHSLRSLHASAQLRSLVKLVGVAALGRFGQEWETRTLVPFAPDTDLWCSPDQGFGGQAYGVRVEERDRETLQVHLASYIHMQVRRALYAKALPYAERGTLIATNYDEVLVSEQPQEAPTGHLLGGWKQHEYVNLRVPYPRAKIADNITPVLPGRPYALRKDDEDAAHTRTG